MKSNPQTPRMQAQRPYIEARLDEPATLPFPVAAQVSGDQRDAIGRELAV